MFLFLFFFHPIYLPSFSNSSFPMCFLSYSGLIVTPLTFLPCLPFVSSIFNALSHLYYSASLWAFFRIFLLSYNSTKKTSKIKERICESKFKLRYKIFLTCSISKCLQFRRFGPVNTQASSHSSIFLLPLLSLYPFGK